MKCTLFCVLRHQLYDCSIHLIFRLSSTVCLYSIDLYSINIVFIVYSISRSLYCWDLSDF